MRQSVVLLHSITAGLAVTTGMLAAHPAFGDAAVVQHRDGTAGAMTMMGDRVGIYSDAHGNTRPLTVPEGLRSGPHGSLPPSTATPFGTVPPPNRLTPAPVLPFHPNRPLMPPSSASPPPGLGSFGSGGTPR